MNDKKNYVFPAIAFIAIVGTLLRDQPWGYIFAIALGIGMFATTFFASFGADVPIRFYAALLMGILAALYVIYVPGLLAKQPEWLVYCTKLGAWLMYSADQVFLMSVLLASGRYRMTWWNSITMVVTALVCAGIVWLYGVLGVWLAVSLGFYTFAVLYPLVRRINQKNSHRYDQRPIKY
jgi:hypothetical protein